MAVFQSESGLPSSSHFPLFFGRKHLGISYKVLNQFKENCPLALSFSSTNGSQGKQLLLQWLENLT